MARVEVDKQTQRRLLKAVKTYRGKGKVVEGAKVSYQTLDRALGIEPVITEENYNKIKNYLDNL